MNFDHVYVIAEAGVNHDGSLDKAIELVDAAADIGADAVKFQTFNAKKLVSTTTTKADYQRNEENLNETQLEMLEKLELPLEWHSILAKRANQKGIDFLSTAFDIGSLDFLMKFNMPFFKVPSGELTNGPLIWRFARSRRPLILSTGMATLSEVELALAIIAHGLNMNREPTGLDEVWHGWSRSDWRNSLREQVTLLHCTSQYPTPSNQVNLRAMDTLNAAFGLSVGYSDHTDGVVMALAAVARGARIIEKHFTLDRCSAGPDHKASIEPNEFRQLVSDIRALSLALGDAVKAPQFSEWEMRGVSRQCIVAARHVTKGDFFKLEDLTTSRSGFGVSPVEIWDLVGTRASESFEIGSIIKKYGNEV